MDFSYISKILTTDIFEINAQDKTNMVTDMIMDTYTHTHMCVRARTRACVWTCVYDANYALLDSICIYTYIFRIYERAHE